MTKNKQDQILDDAFRVIYAAEDSGSYGQECAIEFIEKYPKEFAKWSENYEKEMNDDYEEDDDDYGS